MANKKHILIIEDDPFLLSMYVTKLEMIGYRVSSAEDGKKGLAMILDKKPDLLLLDILLPSMDGFQILEKMKQDQAVKNIPVILLTNLGQKADIEKGVALGADDYLIKAHFTPSEVTAKIKKALGENE